MPSILVTGANGLVGSHLVEKFIQSGYRVKCLVHKNIDFIESLPKDYINIYHGSILQPDTLTSAVEDVDLVFHTAALLKAVSIDKYYKVNQEGTRNLIDAAYRLNKKLKRFVYISSQAAIGPCDSQQCKKMDSSPNPVSDYGKSKLLGEHEVLKYKDKIPITILRPSVIYGPRDKDLFPFFKFVSLGLFPVIKGNEDCKFQVLFVKDLVETCDLITKKYSINRTIYFMSEEKQYTWNEICDLIAGAANKRVKKIVLPRSIANLAAYLSEHFMKLKNKPATFNRQKVTEICQRYWLGDTAETKKEFGYKFTNFEIGAKITYNWYKQNKWL